MPLSNLIVATFFLGMGVAGLVRPAFTVGIMDLKSDSATSRNEVRAVYGGFGLAVGVLLLWAPSQAALGRGCEVAIAVALLGMASGRIVGWVLERTNRRPVVFFGVEIALAALLLRG